MRQLNILKQDDRKRARLEVHAIITDNYKKEGIPAAIASKLAMKDLGKLHIEDIIFNANAKRRKDPAGIFQDIQATGGFGR